MSADFWAGYLSGAAGIIIGNPLDIVKTRLQAGTHNASPLPSPPSATPSSASLATSRYDFSCMTALVRGATAPIVGYGALNALLYMAYNRSLLLMHDSPTQPSSYLKVWSAGAIGGMATFIVSAPTEVIKCRVQVASSPSLTTWSTAKSMWRNEGVRGFYHGGAITSVRDAVGYGFYFWSYEVCKQAMMRKDDDGRETALKVLLCGGIAGIVTWTSIFPLDVIKTKVQTQPWLVDPPVEQPPERRSLLANVEGRDGQAKVYKRLGAIEMAKLAYQQEGAAIFFRGLGVCSLRAFIVNAVQWAVYEWMMQIMKAP